MSFIQAILRQENVFSQGRNVYFICICNFDGQRLVLRDTIFDHKGTLIKIKLKK